MASEVLSKEERASEVKDAQWNETYAPDEICQREGECGRTILRYEATVAQAEERIAELEMRLAEERTAHRRVVGHRDRQAAALADAQLLLGAYASDASWRHGKSWAGDQPGYEPARDCLARIAEKMSSFTLADDITTLREAAEAAAEYLELSSHDPSDSPILVQLREALKT